MTNKRRLVLRLWCAVVGIAISGHIAYAQCPTIFITPAALPNATQNSPYSVTLGGSGGTAPYSFFAVASGSTLPSWLSLTTGVLSGTPTASGIFQFGIDIIDSASCRTTWNMTLNVAAAPPPPCPQITIAPSNLPNATQGTAYSVSFTGSGGTAPYSFAVAIGSTLPSWLSLTTGVLSGTPTASGIFQFGIEIFDSVGCRTTWNMTLNVAGPSCPIATLTAPPNGATVTLPVTFTWAAVDRAIGYKVFVVSPAAAGPTLIGSTSTATQLTTPSLPSGLLQWFVQALFDACPATESSRNSFTVASGLNCPTTAPLQISPANGATDVISPVFLSWGPVSGATSYRLLVSINGGNPAPLAVTAATQFKADLPPESAIEWSVEAAFPNCPATLSPTFRFTTRRNCPTATDAPRLLAPADGASILISPITFQWSAVTNAINYSVTGSVNGGTPVVIGTTTATQLTADVPQGTISWTVEAHFRDCPSTVSTRATFTVTSPIQCRTTPPTLISPPDGASGVKSPAIFQWSPLAGATNYKLFVSLNGTTFDLVGATTATTLTRIVPTGQLLWYVEAEFLGCPSQRSTTFRFTVIPDTVCPTGSISLTAPASGATVTSPAAFSWTSISGATEYRFWLSVDGGAPSAVARTTTTAATVPIASGAGEWYVEALLPNCPSILSPHRTFVVQRINTCDSNSAPTLISPIASGTTVPEIASPVELIWSASAGATGYRAWISFNGQAFADLGLTTETRARRDLLPGSYQWYVESAFASCPSVLSTRSAFRVTDPRPRCGNATPALISPGDGSGSVSSPATFIWSSVPNATQYRLIASHDSSEFALIETTVDTSVTKAIPPGNLVWFVEAAFDACPSTQSPRNRFTIPKANTCGSVGPQLFAPVDGSTKVTPPVDFVWSAVSGAIRYVLMARAGDGVETQLGDTLDTRVTRTVPSGSIEWWVVAFFASCPPVESRHSTFSVPGNCDNRRPIMLSPRSGQTALSSPVVVSWTPVSDARGYKLWVAVENAPASVVASTSATEMPVPLPNGTMHAYVEAIFDGCPTLASIETDFVVGRVADGCRPPSKPTLAVVGQTVSGTAYHVQWTPLSNVSVFELQESTTLDFSNATTQTVNVISLRVTHTATTQPVQYFYRVRGVTSCSDERGPYSDVVGTFVSSPALTATQTQASAEVGTLTNVIQTLTIPGSSSPISFAVTVDKPWLTLTPSSGILGPDGITITIAADPAALVLGTNTATVHITYSGSAKWMTPHGASPPASVPVSVGLATPLSPGGKNTPPPDSLIIPAVAHAAGANDSLFRSDVRVANISAQTMSYQLNFTRSGTDGTQSGDSTIIQIESGTTTALDGILTNFFGKDASASVTGTLEIRPLTTAATTSGFAGATISSVKTTVASSRTYNTTANGTFGQFIPAIPFSQFIGQSSVLSLQQIAQSQAYRTNFGLVEAAGEPATVLVHVFDNSGRELAQIPQTLQPGEYRQINSFLQANGITLTDGRLEIEVTSTTGKVTAYASVVDNLTNDPLLVSPVLKGSTSANRFVLPGVGDFDIGSAHWKSDVRLFNSASAPLAVTLMYSDHDPLGAPRQNSTTMTLQGGEVRAIDNLIATIWPQLQQTAGSLLVGTANPSALIATARTYTQTASGTFGQFIPAVTPAQSVGKGERSLQLLQLEASDRFRTNIGLAETSGSSATAHVSLVLPDSKFTISTDIPLAANEFRQISLSSFGAGTVYNGRVTVSVTGGNGRVTAYGSVIDQLTQDPTYVPAQ